jgi:hypothetical protein
MLSRPTLTAFVLLASLLETSVGAQDTAPGPYDRQVAEHLNKLAADASPGRARAAEALGFLRAYAAEPALIARLEDPSVEVRRRATMALAWCGSRLAVPPLLQKLDDEDWLVRQAAHVSLTNLTGMEFPFDANARAAGGRVRLPGQSLVQRIAARRDRGTHPNGAGRESLGAVKLAGRCDLLRGTHDNAPARMIHRLGRVGRASRVPGGPRSLRQTWLRRRAVNYCGDGLRRPTKILRDLV